MIYNSDELFPNEFIKITGEGVMDGARIVTVEVKPLQYRPKSRRLYLVRPIHFEFLFSPRALPELKAKVRGRYEQAVYDAALQNVVQNKNEIFAYYQKPAIVEEGQLGSLAPYPIGPAIIIAPQEFHSAFRPYADWLTDQGIKTYLITPQTIYWYFPGVDNAEKVRNYIKHCYENGGGTYFILGGDDYSTGSIEFVPVRYCFAVGLEPPDDNNNVPCDMYFSDLTGNWNVDGDTLWGEVDDDEADRFPEVFVSRLTPYCPYEVQNWVEKALGYEKTPNLIDSFALWYYATSPDFPIGDAFTQFPSYFTPLFIPLEDAQLCIRNLSQGYAFNNIHCFGTRVLFSDYFGHYNIYAYWEPNGSQHDDGLNHLDNLNKYILVYTLGALNAGYDKFMINNTYPSTDTTVMDAFLDTYSSIGACAFFGHTRDHMVDWCLDLEYEFYKYLFSPYTGSYPPEPACTRIGVAKALSKCGEKIEWMNQIYRHLCYSDNCFGSPCTEAWTNQPRNFVVSHPHQVYVGNTTQFRVRVRDATTGSYVAHAKVCLNKPNDIYQIGYTDANGQITFTITPQTTGTIKVTITRIHDNNTYIQYFPSQTICQVLEPASGGQSFGSNELLPATICIIDLTTISRANLTINYGIPVQGDIFLKIYDVTGSLVKSTSQANLHPGFYKVIVYTKGLPSGVYFVVLKQNEEQVGKKCMFIR
ncbi:MAG: C25 family cysteine peptidase [bacterium]